MRWDINKILNLRAGNLTKKVPEAAKMNYWSWREYSVQYPEWLSNKFV